VNSLALIAGALAVILAYAIGYRRGKAAGWCEHHFEDIAKDRARRELNGQFKAKEARHA
jgi:hypothetical protein